MTVIRLLGIFEDQPKSRGGGGGGGAQPCDGCEAAGTSLGQLALGRGLRPLPLPQNWKNNPRRRSQWPALSQQDLPRGKRNLPAQGQPVRRLQGRPCGEWARPGSPPPAQRPRKWSCGLGVWVEGPRGHGLPPQGARQPCPSAELCTRPRRRRPSRQTPAGSSAPPSNEAITAGGREGRARWREARKTD